MKTLKESILSSTSVGKNSEQGQASLIGAALEQFVIYIKRSRKKCWRVTGLYTGSLSFCIDEVSLTLLDTYIRLLRDLIAKNFHVSIKKTTSVPTDYYKISIDNISPELLLPHRESAPIDVLYNKRIDRLQIVFNEKFNVNNFMSKI